MIVCPPEPTWQQWLDEVLPETDRAAYEVHLATCAACQSTLDQLTARPAWTWLGERTGGVPPAAPLDLDIPGLDLLDAVGRGGHGVVFRAIQRSLGRVVAVKLLRYGPAATPAERHRLVAEAASLARLRHPNIVQVYDCGEAGGLPYIVMEWLNGGNLAARLDGTPVPPAAAAGLVEALARAVHAAHQAGVVHRDLKPANVLLDTAGTASPGSAAVGGTPKVSDFGLVKFLDVPAERTPTVAILGTPSYMAPEQANGQNWAVGPAADVYALGAILYEMLTGRPPFIAASPFETLVQVRELDPVPPRQLQPRIPRDLETVCLHCLHKALGRRYASAAELADDLGRAVAGLPIRARPVGRVERVRKWARRHPGRVAVTTAAAAVAVAAAAGWAAANERAAAAQARMLVDGLLTADPGEVPALVRQFEPVRPLAAGYLAERAATAPPGSRTDLNARLALLPADPGQVPELIRRIPTSTADDLLVVRGALRPYVAVVAPTLWDVVWTADRDPAERLRAACALAALTPEASAWPAIAPAVAGWLAAENPALVGRWAEALRPVGVYLTEPLAAIARDPARAEAERVTAAGILADYAADHPDRLAGLLLDVEPPSYRAILPAFKRQSAAARPRLATELARAPTADAAEPEKDKLAKRQVRAAVALWHAGDAGPLDAVFRLTGADVRRRHYGIQLSPQLGVDPEFVAGRLAAAADPVTRRSLLLALGDYPASQFGPKRQADLRPLVERLFRDDPDPGVHAAAEWLVRRAWGHGDWLAAAERERVGRPPDGRRWLVTPRGTTMAVVEGPVECKFGSAPDEPHREGEPLSRHLLSHRFALATGEVTRGEFAEFLKDHPEVHYTPPVPDDPRPELPVRRLPWYTALMYCRWLCVKEGVPEEQIPYPSMTVLQAEGAVPFPARFLRRTGYRLPTEEEWECAVRAGTETPRFYGYDPQMLYRYGWALANADDVCHEGGTLRPNDAGLFDVYGNVWEWTQPAPYGPVAGRPGLLAVTHLARPFAPAFGPGGEDLIARGGSYLYHAPFVRSAKRYMLAPPGDTTIGFRIARTVAD